MPALLIASYINFQLLTVATATATALLSCIRPRTIICHLNHLPHFCRIKPASSPRFLISLASSVFPSRAVSDKNVYAYQRDENVDCRWEIRDESKDGHVEGQ